DGNRVTLIEADATDEAALENALDQIDVVFASLAGNIDEQAQAIVSAMEKKNVQRLIFVTALGIYDEVPGAFGKWNNDNIG
ncbi:NAD(P)H-binding protein, partial [Staphylococcus aureus]